MKIYRGKDLSLTDEIEIPDHWLPGLSINVDATIDKDGKRHTAIAIELSYEDIYKLMTASYSRLIVEKERYLEWYNNADKERNKYRKLCEESSIKL